MKTIKKISVLFVAAVVSSFTLSCSGDDSGSGGGTVSKGTIKATVAGSSFTASGNLAYAARYEVMGANSITIYGTDMTGKAIQIIMNGIDGEPGTFEISDDANISVVGTYTEGSVSNVTSWQAPYEDSGVVGSVTITEMTDTGIIGNFEFTGKNTQGTDTKSVTSGAFNLDFMTTP